MRLFGRQITKRDNTANPNKSFLQNYDDHLNFLLKEFNDRFAKWSDKDPFEFLNDELSLHMHMSERLRDGYDLFDEVVGATVVPALTGLVALTTAGMAIFEGVQDLAIHMQWMKAKDKTQIYSEFDASDYLAFAAISLTIAIVSFAKSALSLFTRPIITAIDGWEKQNKDRFYIENSAERKAENCVERVLNFIC